MQNRECKTQNQRPHAAYFRDRPLGPLMSYASLFCGRFLHAAESAAIVYVRHRRCHLCTAKASGKPHCTGKGVPMLFGLILRVPSFSFSIRHRRAPCLGSESYREVDSCFQPARASGAACACQRVSKTASSFVSQREKHSSFSTDSGGSSISSP
jgi:hypothetical protein